MTTPFLRPPNAGTYNATWLAVIDQRIRASQRTTQAMATVTATDPAALRLYAVIDGATLSTPVKMAGHVRCEEGDRVALSRYGTDWVVLGNLSRVAGPNAAAVSQEGTVGTTTSASLADLPGTPAFTFAKRWNDTGMLLFASMSCYTTANATFLTCALRFTAADGTITTYTMFEEGFSTALERHGWAHCQEVAGGLAASTYDVRMRWSRSAGTGTLTHNADDHVSAFALELGV